MTHEPERPYQDRVVDWLRDKFGDGNVAETLYLAETGRYCDVWVSGPLLDYAIEIENDAEAVIGGVGQCLLYQAHDVDAVPVVIVPPGHVDQPETAMLRERVPIVELDV